MKKNSPRVSIIIPVYNNEENIFDVLQDIKKQTYKNIEVLIINDGSTDNSLSIIQNSIRDDMRFKVFSIENGGPSKARNVGLDHSVGDYIRFIDADDRIPRESLKFMLDAYTTDEYIDLVIGNFNQVPDKGYFKGNYIDNCCLNSEDFFELFLEHMKSLYFGVTWNKLYKREIIENDHIRFDEDIIWCEDFLFNLSYYEKCNRISIINLSGGVYTYYTREGSICNSIKECGKRRLEEINSMRYRSAKRYSNLFGKDEEFELEWKYSNLYVDLSTVVASSNKATLKSRYSMYVEILSEEEVKKYIYMKCNKSDIYIWKMLRNSIEKKSFIKSFTIFLVKGYIARNLISLKNLLKEKMDSIFPSN